MASRKTKEKIGFRDLVTFAKAGWTPEETNTLLDRLDSMGDPNEPINDNGDDLDDDTDDDNDFSDDDNDSDDDLDDDTDDPDNEDDKPSDKTSREPKENLDRMKILAYDELVKKNERLEKEIAKIRAKNRNADVSGNSNKKTQQESLIDALQSCF